jgi:hypothetical protein
MIAEWLRNHSRIRLGKLKASLCSTKPSGAIREHLYGVSTIFRDFDVITRRLVDRCVVLCYAGCEFRLEKNRKDNSVTAEKQKRSLPFLIVQLHS